MAPSTGWMPVRAVHYSRGGQVKVTAVGAKPTAVGGQQAAGQGLRYQLAEYFRGSTPISERPFRTRRGVSAVVNSGRMPD